MTDFRPYDWNADNRKVAMSSASPATIRPTFTLSKRPPTVKTAEDLRDEQLLQMFHERELELSHAYNELNIISRDIEAIRSDREQRRARGEVVQALGERDLILQWQKASGHVSALKHKIDMLNRQLMQDMGLVQGSGSSTLTQIGTRQLTEAIAQQAA